MFRPCVSNSIPSRARRSVSRRRSGSGQGWRLFVCTFALVGCLFADRLSPARADQVAQADLAREGVAMVPQCEFPRPQDQLWLVSTRHLGCPSPTDEPPALEVQQYVAGQGWQSSDLPALLDAQSQADRTCVYVHGNRVEWNEALSQGQGLYRRLLVASADAPPACFVIWSWPSSQIRGQLKDVRLKAARTNSEGYYLGWLLSALDPERPLSLIGYSFGARVITGALHLRGGGALAGRTLPAAASSQPSELEAYSARVALLAPALHNDWLSPGHRHELAPYEMDRLLLLYNSCDQALKRYGLSEKGAHPDALGYTGLVYRTPLEHDRITQIDACCIVGKAHDEWRYYNSPSLMRRIRAHALWTDD